MPIDPDVKALAKGANYSALTTLFPSGQPQTNMMWVDADDDHLLVNTETGRVKYANLTNDPRVAVAIWDREDPHRYVEVRGRVVDTDVSERAVEHIHELSHKYRGKPYPNAVDRMIVRIEPTKIVKRNV